MSLAPSQELAIQRDKLMTYEIALRTDLNVLLKLPRDLSRAEAERLKALIDTLPMVEDKVAGKGPDQ